MVDKLGLLFQKLLIYWLLHVGWSDFGEERVASWLFSWQMCNLMIYSIQRPKLGESQFVSNITKKKRKVQQVSAVFVTSKEAVAQLVQQQEDAGGFKEPTDAPLLGRECAVPILIYWRLVCDLILYQENSVVS